MFVMLNKAEEEILHQFLKVTPCLTFYKVSLAYLLPERGKRKFRAELISYRCLNEQRYGVYLKSHKRR